MAPTVAFLGLGNMGRGMCKNIVQKGPLTSPLILWNRTTARATALAESLGNCTVATTIPDAVKPADLIFSCVGDDPALEQIIKTIVDTSDLDIKGKLFVDCSTIHPDTTSRVNETLTARGAEFVACPVFGAPAFADAGQLVCVPAGPKEAVDKVKPYLTGVMGRATIDMSGHEVGRASVMKLLGNTFLISTVATLSEGLVLADKSGLGTDVYHQWLELMFPGAMVKYSNRMLEGDYHKREEPQFAVDLARKDLGHAMSLGKDAGIRLRAVEVADGYLQDVKAHAGAKGDIAGMYGAVRKESGLKFEN